MTFNTLIRIFSPKFIPPDGATSIFSSDSLYHLFTKRILSPLFSSNHKHLYLSLNSKPLYIHVYIGGCAPCPFLSWKKWESMGERMKSQGPRHMKTNVQGKCWSTSPTGNWTLVSRVTGGDTNHYTMEDSWDCIAEGLICWCWTSLSHS